MLCAICRALIRRLGARIGLLIGSAPGSVEALVLGVLLTLSSVGPAGLSRSTGIDAAVAKRDAVSRLGNYAAALALQTTIDGHSRDYEARRVALLSHLAQVQDSHGQFTDELKTAERGGLGNWDWRIGEVPAFMDDRIARKGSEDEKTEAEPHGGIQGEGCGGGFEGRQDSGGAC